MALLLAKPTEYGVDVSYWKLESCEINVLTRACRATLAGWTNEAARLAGNEPLARVPFDWDGASFPLSGPDDPMPIATLVGLLYQGIKARPGWEGAEDT